MRHRLNKSAYALIVVFFTVVGPASAGADFSPQTSAQDGVTVKATPRAVAAGAWEFEIVLDTHSQALADDLGRTAKLVSDGGASYTPTGWRGDAPGGHHRKGTLRFDGVTPEPTYLELHIQRAGERSPRILRWQIK